MAGHPFPTADTNYVNRSKPNQCPVCGSGDIEGTHVEIIGREAQQPCNCFDCGSYWIDRYVLAGYILEEVGRSEEEDA